MQRKNGLKFFKKEDAHTHKAHKVSNSKRNPFSPKKKNKVHRDILSNRIQNKPNPLNNSLKIFRSLKQSLPAKMKATLRRTDRMSD